MLEMETLVCVYGFDFLFYHFEDSTDIPCFYVFCFFGGKGLKKIFQCAAFQCFNKCQTYLSESTRIYFLFFIFFK